MASEVDPHAVELGLKFRSSTDGFITAIRFYKGTQNTGVHVGHLWTASGTLLASATFSNESATGWQQVTLNTPVAVTANTTYVVSYHAPNGFYAATGAAFATAGVLNPPLEALSNTAAGGNGVYRYGAAGFPTQTFNSTNYLVDVVFVTSVAPDTTPPQVASTLPVAGSTVGAVAAPVTVTFSEGMSAGSISTATFELRNSLGALVPATVTYSAATRTAALQSQAPLAYSSAYTATVRGGVTGARDLAGNALAADHTWAFTTVGPRRRRVGPGRSRAPRYLEHQPLLELLRGDSPRGGPERLQRVGSVGGDAGHARPARRRRCSARCRSVPPAWRCSRPG